MLRVNGLRSVEARVRERELVHFSVGVGHLRRALDHLDQRVRLVFACSSAVVEVARKEYRHIAESLRKPDDDFDEEYQSTAYQKDYNDFVEDEPQPSHTKYQEPKVVKKSPLLNLFGLVKTFWRGITFSLGALICLYAFYGVVAQAQTSNDALLYSIWLLIGVILIK